MSDTVLAIALAAMLAARVGVVGPHESGVAGAEVACLDPAGEVATAGENGVAWLTRPCGRARCSAPGMLPAEVAIDHDGATCVLRPGAVVSGTVLAPACGADCTADLVRPSAPDAAVVSVAVAPASGDGAAVRFDLPAVEPGRYRLRLGTDAWRCAGDAGVLPPGPASVTIPWRAPATVSGRVLGPDDDPLAGVEVRASQRDTADWGCGPARAEPTRTDAGGRFAVAVDPGRTALVVAGGWDDAHGVAFLALDGPPAKQIVLRPVRPVRVAARLLRRDDRPARCRATLDVDLPDPAALADTLPGAKLEASCDAEGRLALGPLPPAAFTLRARPSPGLPILVRRPQPEPGATVDLGTLRVDDGETLTVRVVDERDAPVPGAKVRGRAAAGIVVPAEGTTDATGRADLEGLPAHARVDLDVAAERFAPASSTVDLDDGDATVRLEDGASVAGMVVDGEGEPVDGAAVSISTAGRHAVATAKSGADGRFEIASAPSGSIELTASAPGYGSSDPARVRLDPGERREDVVLTLAPARGLRGVVLDPDGRTVTGARVVLIDAWASPDDATIAVYSDSAGRFELPLEPRERQILVATAPGCAPAVEASPLARAGSDLELRLGIAARLVAIIPEGLAPGTRVVARDGAGLVRGAAVAGRTRVPFEDLAKGEGSASLAPGPSRDVSLVAGQTVEVVLDRGATVEGTVTSEGAPVARAAVSLVRADENGIASGEISVLTTADGAFRIEGVPPSRRLAVAIAPIGRAERPVDVPPVGTLRVDLEIDPVVLVASVIDAETARPVAGAAVRLEPVVENASIGRSFVSGTRIGPDGVGVAYTATNCGCGEGTTGPSGRVRIALPATGRFATTVRASGYATWESVLDLASGEQATRVELDPQPTRTVVVDVRTDSPGLEGVLNCRYGGSHWARWAVAGRLECPEPRAGPAEVWFVVDGYGAAHATVDVPEEGEVEVPLEVGPGGTLVVALPDADAAVRIVDENAVDWADLLRGDNVATGDVPGVGLARTFRAVPPGTYRVVVGDTVLRPVDVEPGVTAVAR